ncbi:MAG: AmmeMemoRadiSam system protein A [Bacilli bacterium]|nr:AmmeMemoRadiSam system protein A [Bacilli bacterium]
MSVVASFLLPHHPALIPEIAGDKEALVEKTIEAYQKVANKIAEIKPDTIVFASPHAESYLDYFQFSLMDVVTGTMARFGNQSINFRAYYDRELTEKICSIAKENDVLAGFEGEEEFSLSNDHGTMVPLYFINKVFTDYKIVRLGLTGMPFADHYRMGMTIKKAADVLDRKVVVIASGDLAHRVEGEDPSYANRYDEMIINCLTGGNFGDLLFYDQQLLDNARECGHRAIVVMAGALDQSECDIELFHYSAPIGVGYGLIGFYPKAVDNSRAYLEIYLSRQKMMIANRRDNSDIWVKLAYAAIDTYLKEDRVLTYFPNLPDEMTVKAGGVFVTLKENGAIRGCIGAAKATQACLADEVIANAIAAAFQDDRFPEVKASELPYIDIIVDQIGPMEKVHSLSALDPKEYGIVVENGQKRGLLLPNLDSVTTVSQQIEVACRKAGLEEDEPYNIYRFKVIRHQ